MVRRRVRRAWDMLAVDELGFCVRLMMFWVSNGTVKMVSCSGDESLVVEGPFAMRAVDVTERSMAHDIDM